MNDSVCSHAVCTVYICTLFVAAVSNKDYVVLNDWFIVSNELERIRKEAVMAQFKVVSWDVPVGTEENLSLDRQLS